MNGQNYDANLQMFVEEPRNLNYQRLIFLRWLASKGKLEHGVAGASSGEVVKELGKLTALKESVAA